MEDVARETIQHQVGGMSVRWCDGVCVCDGVMVCVCDGMCVCVCVCDGVMVCVIQVIH